VLNIVLALDGIPDVVKPLEVDEPFHSVSFGEAFDKNPIDVRTPGGPDRFVTLT
jgi:hypothetical protein